MTVFIVFLLDLMYVVFCYGNILKASEIPVIVNGMPGLMAQDIAKVTLDRGFNLLPLGFTGPGQAKFIEVQGKDKCVTVELVEGPGISSSAVERLKALKKVYPNIVAIDFTHPSAIMGNLASYLECGCDFVMGTTGGDPQMVLELFNKGNVLAVIAPNMAKQIVATQAALLDISTRFPNSFKDYELTVTESHQSTKADTSGTAKAIVGYLSKLTGDDFSFERIVKLRQEADQLGFGVPKDFLDGHAFHTYRLTSPDKTTTFELKHNVCGRRIYSEGTLDAVEFLAEVRAKNNYGSKRLYSMIDVLESGKML